LFKASNRTSQTSNENASQPILHHFHYSDDEKQAAMMISLNIPSIFLLCTYASCVVLSTTAFSAVSPVDASSSSKSTSLAASIDKIWNEVPEGPPDAILGIAQAFRAAPDEHKVNVCVGAYRDTDGKPWVLPSVRKAEEMMLADNTENKEYLPIEGDQAYVAKALKFAYGANAPLDRIAGVQTLSGTGACRIGGQFLADFYPNRNIYVPDRTSNFGFLFVLTNVLSRRTRDNKN
jgi:hypothetical protein